MRADPLGYATNTRADAGGRPGTMRVTDVGLGTITTSGLHFKADTTSRA
jgi:hypothetical protein